MGELSIEQLEYHNIRITCLKTQQELQGLKNKENYNEKIIEKAYEIISNYEKSIEIPKKFGKDIHADTWILYGRLYWSDLDSILINNSRHEAKKIWIKKEKEISEIKLTIKSILDNKKMSGESLDNTIDFFGRLHDKCPLLSQRTGCY